MELTKYSGTEILAHIRHDLRQIPYGKTYGNESVDYQLSHRNYSLINRGKTAAEVNQYRKDFESKIFKYNRKNLVHAVELVIQCPEDCPSDQQEAFFQTAFNWYCNTYLPAGEDCVFVAEVHRDEHKFITTIENGLELKKDISKSHLHIAYVPAIPAGKKHPNYQYRLNADALTKRAILREMHPSLQNALDEAGIKATIFQRKSGTGKTVPLTVKQLKEITDKTGIVIDHTLTIDELANILSQNLKLNQTIEALTTTNSDNINQLNSLINTLEHQVTNLKSELKAGTVTAAQEKNELQEQIKTLQKRLKIKDFELQKEQQKVHELEEKNATLSVSQKEHTWDNDSGWGSSSGWGNTANKNHTIEEEKLW